MGLKFSFIIKSALILIPISVFAQDNVLVDLSEFYAQDVNVAGFSLTSSQEIKIETAALTPHRSNYPVSDAWILNSDSRDAVWLLEDADDTESDDDITFYNDAITLEPGNYEVYYSTYFKHKNGYWERDDYRGHGFFSRLFRGFSDDNEDDWYIRRRDYKKLFIKISGSGTAADEDKVLAWQSAKKESALIDFTQVDDDYFAEKLLNVNKPVTLKIYALGEATSDGDYDFGWIINQKTREKIWTLNERNSMYAGGARKNRLAEETLKLEPGVYKIAYVTDDSHSFNQWNSAPPYDPYFWGVSVWLDDNTDKAAISVQDVAEVEDKNMVVDFERVGDSDYRSQGFTLKKPLKLHIFALGEGRDGNMYDYGWIVESKTHKRVWEMDYYKTEHAGGANKNRMFDGIISLEPGNYIAYYVSDGSHSYRRWNAGRPFYENKWGMQINVADDKFVKGDVTDYKEDEDSSVLVRINRVGDYDRARSRFSLDHDQEVHIYAIGEGDHREMYDFAWIENVNTGHTVWKMRYGDTERAGGAHKNRMFDDNIFLESGEYEVFYESDDSHSFGDWNDRPPNDPINWGITITKIEK